MDSTTATSSITEQLQPPTGASVFSSLDFDMYSTSSMRPIGNSHDESLSDVDVNLDDLDSTPSDFVAPMLNEDSLPIDSDSNTSSNNNDNNHEDNNTLI
jgi:hypothetical protein